MAIWIDDNLCKFVKKEVVSLYPQKKSPRCVCKARTWLSSRYIQIATPIRDGNIHYELLLGRLQLHFEGKFAEDEYKPLRQLIEDSVPNDNTFLWRKRYGLRRGACEWNIEIEDRDTLIKGIQTMVDKFDPLIAQYMSDHTELFSSNSTRKDVPQLSYSLEASNVNTNPDPTVKCIYQLPFEKLTIPPYQRPYKWTAKNVNQLITDIISFRNKKQYRLGTLVLHNGEIVDGQQRIVTLTLLLKVMYGSLHDDKLKDVYKKFMDNVTDFTKHVQFPSRYSLHNVVENVHTIEERKADFDDGLFEFILNKCEFVVVELSNISEAFQFFDSQNARGKDLAAHDLLKAFHLREIIELTSADSLNIDIWQNQKTEFLVEVFLHLYRAKRWSQGKSARYFTKKHIGEFKGVSLRDGKCYPFYQKEVIAHIFSEIYKDDPMRYIDHNIIEYPFNLDDQVVNGSRFFDMIRHYMELYRKVKKIDMFPQEGEAHEILSCINGYEGMWRTGDQYVRSMFNTLLVYYIDRFGWVELNKVMPKFFIWAYKLRLENKAVQLASIDNYASQNDSLIRLIHSAKTPYDIINRSIDGVHSLSCQKCDKIVEKFKNLNKFQVNV